MNETKIVLINGSGGVGKDETIKLAKKYCKNILNCSSVDLIKEADEIAENYRQLVLNYEHKRDYDTAEDFHVGEMEMRRKKKGVKEKWPWLGWLVDGMSVYGI